MNTQTPEPAGGVSKEDAQTLLAPLLPRMAKCFYLAWQRWMEHTALFGDFSPRSRASMIHDFICNAVKQEFKGESGVTWSEQRRFFELYVENARHGVSIRFKKLDRNNRPSNIQTRQQILYVRQLPLPLEGVPALITRLTAGYRLDAVAAAMQELLMIYQAGSDLVWSFGFEGTRVDVTPLVTVPPEPVIGPKVRAKNVAREDRKIGEE